jgi:hypothetical protein
MPSIWAAAAPTGKRALLNTLVLVLVVVRVVSKQHPEVTIVPTSPAVTPAKKVNSGKAQVKATQKIIAPIDKSKI